MVLLHGLRGHAHSWDDVSAAFCSNYHVMALDQRGRGDSDWAPDGNYATQAYVDDLAAFIEALKLPPFTLVGHSMGGRISQVYIVNHPENIIGAVLAGTGARIRVTKTTLETAKSDFKKFSELAAGNSFSRFATKELIEKFRMRLAGSSQKTCINDLIACNEFDVMGDVSKITVPTLIIAGEEDILAPIRHSKYLYRNIPDSRLEIISKAGHFMMQERPDEFNRLLVNYLNFL